MQWLICQLHANELPLRHLLTHLDGSTSGPRAFSGVIGKELVACETLPIVSFSPIDGDLPDMANLKSDLSTDQSFLYDMCQAISKGQCLDELARRDPGAISHSRWLTAANRMLRLYVSTCNPSENLKILVTYIIKVYAPVWFAIKSKSSCKFGTIHLWQTILRSRHLSENLKAIVDPVIQRNAYFGHPENILLCMLGDDRKHIRELGMRRILRARSEVYGMRRFVVPLLNFNATDYYDIIDWQNTVISELPLLKGHSQDDIEMFVACRETPAIDFPKYPCHTQAVERCVKLVTESSMAVCGVKARDGFIRVRLQLRQTMPFLTLNRSTKSVI